MPRRLNSLALILGFVAVSAFVVVVVIIGSGEDARVVPAVSWGVLSASFLLAAHTLIHVFETLSKPCPVIKDQPPQEKFPWKSPTQNNAKQTSETSGIFGCFKLVTLFLDSEGRRKKKWDAEKKKWRDLQQQLLTLRSIRAQRAAILSSLTSQECKQQLQVEKEDDHYRREKPNKSCRHEKRHVKTYRVQQTAKETMHFPWKS